MNISPFRSEPASIADALGRPLRQLRISVTDRCNFRCTYCMPKAVFGARHRFLARDQLLTFEEIERIVCAFVSLGVEKVRLTGGEPTMRRGLPHLVERLAAIPGLKEINLTTNGSRIINLAPALKDAGLTRITVSLDSLDDRTFRAMNDVNFPVARVLAGIEAAVRAGFTDLKTNTVVRRGWNEDGIFSICSRFRNTGVTPRFIEFMDAGNCSGWKMDEVVPAAEIVETIHARYPLEPLPHQYRGEVAERWRYADGSGEVGVIASVTRPFCGDCSRLRLSADGRIYTCLFGVVSHDLRAPIRAGATDEDLSQRLRSVWTRRADRFSEQRGRLSAARHGAKPEMSYIGG